MDFPWVRAWREEFGGEVAGHGDSSACARVGGGVEYDESGVK